LIKLSYSAYNGQQILCIIETDGTENQEDFIKLVGNVAYTEYVSPCIDKKYLIQAVCHDIDEYSHLRSCFSNVPEITSINTDPINAELGIDYSLTKYQALVLSNLVDVPRKQLNVVAESLEKSSKSVARTIRKLRESDIIEFTVECSISSLVVVINYEIKSLSPSEIKRRLTQEFDCFWELKESSNRPLVYAFFFSEFVDDLHIVEKNLKENEFEILDVLIAGPRYYFNSKRDEELKNLIDKSIL
jgi:DNA-binding Lrp family transcriptional regulator